MYELDIDKTFKSIYTSLGRSLVDSFWTLYMNFRMDVKKENLASMVIEMCSIFSSTFQTRERLSINSGIT